MDLLFFSPQPPQPLRLSSHDVTAALLVRVRCVFICLCMYVLVLKA